MGNDGSSEQSRRSEHGENYAHSGCILDVEPMFSEALDFEFEKRNNTKYRLESQSIISIQRNKMRGGPADGDIRAANR